MQTTINSQLILSMLCESIAMELDAQILQANTDGITAMVHRTDIEDYYKICEQWQKTTMVKLEFVECNTMWMWDVNCYILSYIDPLKEPKVKGRIAFKDLELHRDKSFLVVNKAIYEFFVNGIFPEEYLKTNRDIYDWCGGGRVKSEWNFVGTCVNERLVEYTPLQKVVRYYISNKGCKIVKINRNDNRRINLVAGPWYQTVFNDYVELPWEDYDLDERYYLQLIRKEIEILQKKETKQMSLF